jgi:hypothetical protein
MNINRHNYEEFFILYMDNELCSDDRRMVEAFVLQHPDLKEELDLLVQFKMSPDAEILFPGKEELIRINGETPVTINNYQEWMLLYIDNELTPVQKNNVEQFIQTNSSVKEELTLLLKAKLQPEQIVFANKQTLYRREEKVRVVPFRWWRAAAVLILALGLTAVLVLNNKPTLGKDGVAKNQPVLKEDKGNNKSLVKINSENSVIAPVNKENAPVNEIAVADNVKEPIAPIVKQNVKNNIAKNSNTVIKDKTPANISTPVKKEEQVLVVDYNNKPSNNLPLPVNNPNINKSNVSNDAVAITNVTKEPTTIKESNTSAPVTNIIPASYNMNDAAQLEEGGKNKKNRGFLRKLTRTFEKRTNMTATDDDKLLVGGLAFKLK